MADNIFLSGPRIQQMDRYWIGSSTKQNRVTQS